MKHCEGNGLYKRVRGPNWFPYNASLVHELIRRGKRRIVSTFHRSCPTCRSGEIPVVQSSEGAPDTPTKIHSSFLNREVWIVPYPQAGVGLDAPAFLIGEYEQLMDLEPHERRAIVISRRIFPGSAFLVRENFDVKIAL